jgi:hypothetical protein
MLQRKEYAICHVCLQVKKEYGAYSWDKKQQKLGIDAPLKQHDHTKDAERYYLWTKYGAPRNIIDLSSIQAASSFSRG